MPRWDAAVVVGAIVLGLLATGPAGGSNPTRAAEPMPPGPSIVDPWTSNAPNAHQPTGRRRSRSISTGRSCQAGRSSGVRRGAEGERAHPGVRSWFTQAEEEALYTSVLVVGELRRGIELLRRRDVPSALALDHWLAGLTDGFADRILPVDQAVAERWGRLNVPDPVPTVDGLLAATAFVHGMTLVTRNTQDVAKTGVSLLDPTT